MKPILCFLLTVCLALHAQAKDPEKFEVHEWGTITVLSGSDGHPVNWYQGFGYLDELPSFVQPSPFGSKGGPFFNTAKVRMETPVIYFYPDAPMQVSVTASFQAGQLTEFFPQAKGRLSGLLGIPEFTWEGKLHTPTDAWAQQQIPAVPDGKGDHYRHARDVPDAWIFHGSTPAILADGHLAKGRDADKFIFYRGKGEGVPPFHVTSEEEGAVTLRHFGIGGAITSAFALTVDERGAQWTRMPQLAAATLTDHQAVSTARLDVSAVPVEKAAVELAAAMRESLVTAGLTQDEANAMVATWNGHWFREPGTRVLAILPRDWVDQAVPLTIKPTPTKLTRVFVARFEVLTREREAETLTLLKDSGNDVAQAERLQKLQLGRFAQGALARAQLMENQRMAERFGTLQQAAQKLSTECKSATTAWAR
jgi:hypothetical protein